ncbi:MAG: AraC family transcriptional regulator [Actinomycetota bacterium]
MLKYILLAGRSPTNAALPAFFEKRNEFFAEVMKQKSLINNHLGQTKETMQIGGVIFTQAIYSPNIKFPKHSHRNACFTLIHQGGYLESFGNKIINAKPNSVIFRPPEESHFDNFGSSGVCCSLMEIDKEWFEQLSGQTAIIQEPFGFDNGQIVWQTSRLCREFQKIDDVSRLVIEGLMMEMLANTKRSIRKNSRHTPPHWLRLVKELLHDQFAENLSLGEIAQVGKVHPSYLANAFRRFFGASIGEYVRQLRIEFACRELATTNTSLVEIALNAGFSHQAHFTNAFKRSTGMSPTQYRTFSRQS